MQFIESINVICFPSVAKLKLFLKSAQSARSNLESESMSEELTQREGGGTIPGVRQVNMTDQILAPCYSKNIYLIQQ